MMWLRRSDELAPCSSCRAVWRLGGLNCDRISRAGQREVVIDTQ